MKAVAAILDLIPGWVWALVCAGMLAFGITQEVRIGALKGGLERARASEFELRATHAREIANAHAEARRKENQLTDAAAQMRSRKDAEIQTLASDVRNLRDRLRNLPQRPAASEPAQVAEGGAPAVQCDGPILYQEDGQLLVDEAERAEAVRLELLRQYDLWGQASRVINDVQ